MDTSLMMAAAMFGKCCGSHPHLAAAGVFVAGVAVGFACAKLIGGKKKKPQGAQRPQRSGDAQRPKEMMRRSSEARVPIPAGSVEIYVGNLSYDMTEDQLRKTFEEFGKVDTVRVVTNHFNGKSKGFAFVVMPNRPEAEAAIAALDNKEVLGRPMRVNEAKNTLKESV